MWRNKNQVYKQLYERYYAQLILVSLSITRQVEASEDLVQSLFLKIIEKKLYRKIEIQENYLVKAIKYASLNYMRDKKQIVDCIIDILPDFIDTPYDFEESFQEIEYHINQLPDSCRDIFKKVVLEEWTYESVALHMNLSINTIKSHIKKAYKILRKKTS